MRLWSELHRLGKRAIYCDTDSIIYEHRPDEYNIPSGGALGAWEIEKVHYEKETKQFKPMTHFVSTGPKCKAFWIDGYNNAKHECGAKGFTLDINVQEQINYNGMRSLVTGEQEEIEVKKVRFKRTKEGMRNFKEPKKLQFVMNKRCLNEDYTSVPHGYKDICAN